MGAQSFNPAMVAGVLSFLFLVFTSSDFAHAAAYVKPGLPGFGAVHNGALLGADMSPRYFLYNSIPATPGKKRQLLGRQDDDGSDDDLHFTDCGEGEHSCYNVAPDGASFCCPNDQFCFTNPDWTLKCCHFDAGCDDKCSNQEQQLCNATNTITTTSTITQGPSSTGTRVMPTQETVLACCDRFCGVSSFQCVGAFGNQCCPNDQQCGTSGQCLSNITPTPTPVTPIPEGCTATTQIACPSESGGGCCNVGQTCIGETLCGFPGGTSTADTSASGGNAGGDSLSQSAKAGIGVGVAVGVSLVIGGLAWFCVQRRRHGGATGGTRSRSRTNTSGGAGGPRAAIGGAFGALTGGMGAGRRNRRDRDENHNESGAEGGDPSGPSTAFLRDRDVMSEISNTTSGVGGPSRPALHSSGLTYNYFGPDAIAGPYTTPGIDEYNEGDSDYYGVGGAGAAGTIGPDGQYHTFPTPGLSTNPPQQERGVPLQPRGPEDITAPVEIDSNKLGGVGAATSGDDGDLTPHPHLQQQQQQQEEHKDFGPFELVGSPGIDETAPANEKGNTTATGGSTNDNNNNDNGDDNNAAATADFGDSPTYPQLEQDMKARAMMDSEGGDEAKKRDDGHQ